MKISKHTRAAILILAALLTACGQKGALYLPEDAPPAQTENDTPKTEADQN